MTGHDARDVWIRETVAAMTLEEKASLCSGKDFWTTKAIGRLGIPSLILTDGPHGLRMQATAGDHTDLRKSLPTTCFPSGAALAASWNPDLVEEVGAAIGEEAREKGVAVLLGPSVNIKRSPLCGRNFEYFSEDPCLAGKLAAAFIRGVQSRGVGASVKHFAVNNQERFRFTVNAVVDERTLREIYLSAFETAIREGHPWTVMCAYNRLNGEYCSQNHRLLTGILREEWGYDGVLITDWGACDDRVKGLAAGQDLEMPGTGGEGDRAIIEAVRSGALTEAVLDCTVERLLRLCLRARAGAEIPVECSFEAHHALARRAAAESIVLLRNEGGILPLRQEGRIAFIGAFARQPRYQGGGSSHLNPTRLDSALDAVTALFGNRAELSFAAGYDPATGATDDSLLGEARSAAARADVAVLFAGLTEVMESEGYDRTDLRLPEGQRSLIEAVAAVQKRLVVVLQTGAPVEMPWINRVPAVLEDYLAGQGGGNAIADILFGLVNPSGRLAETFPRRLEDTPAFLNFPGDGNKVEYREGGFVGYRYYDAVDCEPLFPFGFGLSYTSFSFTRLTVDRDELSAGEDLGVSVTVQNTGTMTGRETIQVYAGRHRVGLPRPLRTLCAFRKISLEPGEEAVVSLVVPSRTFTRWDTDSETWLVDGGKVEIAAGSSSRELPLSRFVTVRPVSASSALGMGSTVAQLSLCPGGRELADRMRLAFIAAMGNPPMETAEGQMASAMAEDLPLRTIIRMTGGAFDRETVERYILNLNG